MKPDASMVKFHPIELADFFVIMKILCAPEGIRTPNLLIRSFALRLSKRVSKFLLLRSFACFKRESVLFVPSDLLRYLCG